MEHPAYSHLRAYRRRSGLTQRELGQLMCGCRSELGIRNYERYGRKPHLKAAFSGQVIFDVPVTELFPDVYEAVEAEVIEQTHLLVQALSLRETTPAVEHKLSILRAIIERTAGAHE